MLPHKNDTYELILQTARALVQTKSYSGFGFEELAQTVGIRKASVYYHFASKEALGIALMTKMQEQIRALYQDNLGKSGLEQLRSFLTVAGCKIGVGHNICPGAALTANWDALPDELKHNVLQLRDTYLELFTAMVSAGRQDETIRIRAGTSDDILAKSIIASYQGGIILARLSAQKSEYDTVIEELLDSLSSDSHHA